MTRKRPTKKSVAVKARKAGAKSRAVKKVARSPAKSPVVAKKAKAKAGKQAAAPPAKTARAAKARRTVAKKASRRASAAKTSARPVAKPAAKKNKLTAPARRAAPRKSTEANATSPNARRAAPRISAGRRADSRKTAGREALAKNTLALRAAPARKPARKSPAKKRAAKVAPTPKPASKIARSRLSARATKAIAPPVLRDAARRPVVKQTAPRPEKPAKSARRGPFRLHALGVREEHATDRPQISALLSEAFARPDEAARIERARANGNIVLALVAEYDNEIIGHIAFARIEALMDGKHLKAVELFVLAVAPARQKRGIGSALVGAGLEAARTTGFEAAFVAAEPAFFGRLGFSTEGGTRFESAGGEALAAIELKADALGGAGGAVTRFEP